MADNQSRMMLHSHVNNVDESDGNGLGGANPSAAAKLEVSGPGADRNLVGNAGNLLLQTTGTLPQMNKVVGDDLQGAAAQASNLGTLNGAAVGENNLLVTSMHDTVQQGGTNGFNNGQLGFFVSNDDLLNPSAGVPHTTQAGGAGDENENEFNDLLDEEAEESEDSDQDDYAEFMPAEMLNRFLLNAAQIEMHSFQ